MRKIFLLAAAIPALACATAMAQNDTTKAPANPANSRTSPMTSPAPAPQPTLQATPKEGPNFVNIDSTNTLSSNVVGLDIYNGQNNDIGKIQDVAFDNSMKVTGYILSVGGFLGMGTHYVAVDPSSVMVRYDESNKTWRASMNATKDQLKSAPEFKYGGQWTASRS
jgi:hypothetical protein